MTLEQEERNSTQEEMVTTKVDKEMKSDEGQDESEPESVFIPEKKIKKDLKNKNNRKKNKERGDLSFWGFISMVYHDLNPLCRLCDWGFILSFALIVVYAVMVAKERDFEYQKKVNIQFVDETGKPVFVQILNDVQVKQNDNSLPEQHVSTDQDSIGSLVKGFNRRMDDESVRDLINCLFLAKEAQKGTGQCQMNADSEECMMEKCQQNVSNLLVERIPPFLKLLQFTDNYMNFQMTLDHTDIIGLQVQKMLCQFPES